MRLWSRPRDREVEAVVMVVRVVGCNPELQDVRYPGRATRECLFGFRQGVVRIRKVPGFQFPRTPGTCNPNRRTAHSVYVVCQAWPGEAMKLGDLDMRGLSTQQGLAAAREA